MGGGGGGYKNPKEEGRETKKEGAAKVCMPFCPFLFLKKGVALLFRRFFFCSNITGSVFNCMRDSGQVHPQARPFSSGDDSL